MRGEMQCMGLGLQTSVDGMKGIMAVACDETRTPERKMATPRRGTNEPRRSVEVCRPAMETGEVGTRDAVTIIRETCRTRHVEVTEKLTVTEMRIIKEIKEETNKHEETKGVTETQIRKDNKGRNTRHGR